MVAVTCRLSRMVNIFQPDTVPQASIDMNKVGEVTDAEEMTGNAFSIAITTSDGVHFVKGTCREEAKWWKDVLSVYPRSKVPFLEANVWKINVVFYSNFNAICLFRGDTKGMQRFPEHKRLPCYSKLR